MRDEAIVLAAISTRAQLIYIDSKATYHFSPSLAWYSRFTLKLPLRLSFFRSLSLLPCNITSLTKRPSYHQPSVLRFFFSASDLLFTVPLFRHPTITPTLIKHTLKGSESQVGANKRKRDVKCGHKKSLAIFLFTKLATTWPTQFLARNAHTAPRAHTTADGRDGAKKKTKPKNEPPKKKWR